MQVAESQFGVIVELAGASGDLYEMHHHGFPQEDVLMPPLARLTDLHTCPMTTGPVPHVGGPIAGPGCPTVLIGGLPAACVGDTAVCVGPPDAIAMGNPRILIGGRPAAFMGSVTAHGGFVVSGCPTVQG